ncbi:phosphodiesterase [Micromonospora sp. WMMD1120]|uniref:phosphodiesterase n=1 Tax=Micromonospora sp. WMMD1120 TaxID=3016106 RepID=UPI0024169229|nr:phosphodiesterase [Micromonospora sp. WMMD1120]MDG4805831.1 phosphodiesterase [Micromonospora sp. WMMD1120]
MTVTPPPSRPATRAAVERASAALARLRRGRLLHPAGRSFAGETMIWGTPGPPTGVGLLDDPGRYPTTVRLSKGTPTPGSWPDVLGLALRLHHDSGRPFDLLVSSSGAAPLLRNLPLPRRRFTGTYSTIVSYRVGRRRLWLAALADPEAVDLGRSLAAVAAATRADTPRLVLAVASAVGPWRAVGQVSLGAQLSAEADLALAFDPVHNLPTELRMAGPVAVLRDLTYRGSRRARGATAQSGGSTAATV